MLTCDNCDKPFEVDDDVQVGEKVSCPYCGDINRAPAHGAPRAGTPISAAATAALAHEPAVSGSVAMAAGEEPERTILEARQAMFRAHPFWYSMMVLLGLAGIAVTALSLGATPILGAAWLLPGLIAIGAAVVWWVVWWAAPHRWVRLTVTNKRSIRTEGIVVRKTSEVLHRHVTNVTIEQGLLNRLLGVGYIGIDSAGQGGEPEAGDTDSPRRRSQIEIEVDNVPNPYQIKAIIDKFR